FTPPQSRPFFAGLVGDRFRLAPQDDGDLGVRMAAFFAEQLQAGSTATVLVGTDSPTLPLAFIGQAFSELQHADVVLGPATDGGYYLVGIAGRLPPLFDGITWGGPGVLGATVRCLSD